LKSHRKTCCGAWEVESAKGESRFLFNMDSSGFAMLWRILNHMDAGSLILTAKFANVKLFFIRTHKKLKKVVQESFLRFYWARVEFNFEKVEK
jgi:hypothetical protein